MFLEIPRAAEEVTAHFQKSKEVLDLSKAVLETPSLEGFKKRLGGHLSRMGKE